jgi:hypothetical protein
MQAKKRGVGGYLNLQLMNAGSENINYKIEET